LEFIETNNFTVGECGLNDVIDEGVAGEGVGGFGGVDGFVDVEHEFVKVYFLFDVDFVVVTCRQ